MVSPAASSRPGRADSTTAFFALKAFPCEKSYFGSYSLWAAPTLTDTWTLVLLAASGVAEENAAETAGRGRKWLKNSKKWKKLTGSVVEKRGNMASGVGWLRSKLYKTKF